MCFLATFVVNTENVEQTFQVLPYMWTVRLEIQVLAPTDKIKSGKV